MPFPEYESLNEFRAFFHSFFHRGFKSDNVTCVHVHVLPHRSVARCSTRGPRSPYFVLRLVSCEIVNRLNRGIIPTVIVGDGSEKKGIRDAAQQQGECVRVWVCGFVEKEGLFVGVDKGKR